MQTIKLSAVAVALGLGHAAVNAVPIVYDWAADAGFEIILGAPAPVVSLAIDEVNFLYALENLGAEQEGTFSFAYDFPFVGGPSAIGHQEFQGTAFFALWSIDPPYALNTFFLDSSASGDVFLEMANDGDLRGWLIVKYIDPGVMPFQELDFPGHWTLREPVSAVDNGSTLLLLGAGMAVMGLLRYKL